LRREEGGKSFRYTVYTQIWGDLLRSVPHIKNGVKMN